MADIKDWDYKMLYEEPRVEINKLMELYDKNRQHARVVFLNGEPRRYSYMRLCLFDDPDSEEFDIVQFNIRHGISVTNKKYHHSKRVATLRFRKKTGFWFCQGRQIRRPNTLSNDFQLGNPSRLIQSVLMHKFSWYRTMIDNKIDFDKHLTVHKVWSKKIFNLNKLLKACYNVPIGPAKLLHKQFGQFAQGTQLLIYIRTYGKFYKNIENLSAEWLHGDEATIFKDSLDMAKKLGKVVNCSWGYKRLKKEHDDWSEEMTNILFVEDNKPLTIKGVFYEFAKFANYYMIKTTRGLATEGQKQKHCVGGYGDAINSGRCAIFHVEGYTLELKNEMSQTSGRVKNKFKLVNNQFRGFRNKSAPEELQLAVQEKINEFNEQFKDHECLNSSWYSYNSDDEFGRVFNITEGAEEHEIFNLDVLDENGEPERILFDETIRGEGSIEIQQAEYWNGNDDMPF